jgi:hypothetical protein
VKISPYFTTNNRPIPGNDDRGYVKFAVSIDSTSQNTNAAKSHYKI